MDQVCSPTSGGQFNPAVTICSVLFKGMSKCKAVRFVVIYQFMYIFTMK